MATGKVLPYLDVPLQHAQPRILKAMKRPANSENTLARLNHWRSLCPDITVRSTFIVGFTGETDDDFEYLLDFLQEAQLDRVGCFMYSPVTGAAANALANPVPEEIKEERLSRFMAAQQIISTAKLQRKIGKTMMVLIDEIDADGAVTRSAADAPDIDGQVFIEDTSGLNVGEFVEVKIIAAEENDLWGERVTP